MVKLVFFTTDIFIYLMLMFTAIIVYFNIRKEHLRRIWKTVFSSKLAVASATIIMLFFGIALLDSIHFKFVYPSSNATEIGNKPSYVYSVLDLVLTPRDDTYETSYSAPFALHAFSKSDIMSIDGKIIWGYARLHYVNNKLLTGQMSIFSDIAHNFIKALFMAAIAWILFFVFYQLMYEIFLSGKIRFRFGFSKSGFFPHRFFLILIFILLFISIFTIFLSHDLHIFGTTKVGEDVFYQTMKSIRTGVLIGTITTIFTLPFAIILGILAGYFGGVTDDIIQYLYTTLSSIPGILLIAASILSLEVFFSNHPQLFSSVAQQADIRLLVLCLILAVTSWTDLCRLLRAETYKVREYDYITAAKALGVNSTKIITKHILPNVMHIIIITMVLNFSGLVLAEAVLSYVGAGVDPSMYSWGNMINSARLELARSPMVWWPLFSAFLFMFTLVLSANIFSEKVRTAFDPRGI